MQENTILIIIIVLLSSTAFGLWFSMALKNFDDLPNKLTYVLVLSIAFTPVGARFLSNMYRFNKNIAIFKKLKKDSILNKGILTSSDINLK